MIVKADVAEQVGFRLLIAGKARQLYPLGLQRTEEALQRGVVPAVPRTRMAGHDPMSSQQSLVVVRAVLAATIRIQQHLFLWLLACHSHLQRGVLQSLLHAAVHRPTNNGARIEIEHDGQIQLALSRPH